MSTPYEARARGEQPRHLGVLSVELSDIQPHDTREYKKRLPFPAGIGLRSVNSSPN